MGIAFPTPNNEEFMSAPALASIGDHGVLNASLPEPLSEHLD